MTRDQVLDRLKAHEAELRRRGLAALYLFGSTARGQATSQSDIDFACDVDETKNVGLIELAGIQLRLEDLLSADVDLVERHCLRESMRQRIANDMVRVF